jgi:hypothetical protein
LFPRALIRSQEQLIEQTALRVAAQLGPLCSKEKTMPGSNQRTRISVDLKTVSNTKVIEFETPPRYRNLPVDISKNNKLVLHDILSMNGNNEGGNRAKVDNITQTKSGFCRVIIDDCKYKIHSNYTGQVSVGVEEY